MLKQKPIKALNTSKSVIGFNHEIHFDIQPDVEKIAKINSRKGKKSGNPLEKSISPSTIRNISSLSSTKSSNGLCNIKFPLKNPKKNESSYIKETLSNNPNKKVSENMHQMNIKQASLLLNSASPNNSKIHSPLNISLSPSLYIKAVPSIISSDSPYKNFNLKEELELNTKVFQKNFKYQGNTCLENIFSLDEKRENKYNFENSLKLCTNVLRDIIYRMDEKGKRNEGILLDKLWRFALSVFDDVIECMNQRDLIKEFILPKKEEKQDDIKNINLQKEIITRKHSKTCMKTIDFDSNFEKALTEKLAKNKITEYISNITKSLDELHSSFFQPIKELDPFLTSQPYQQLKKCSYSRILLL